MSLRSIILVECPNCDRANPRLISLGRCLAWEVWTDGRRELYEDINCFVPEVVKCPSCGEFYWTEQATERQVECDREPLDWSEPSEGEYYDAINRGFATTHDEERKLRVLAWRRRNDDLRGTSKTTWHARTDDMTPSEDCRRHNLDAPSKLLNEENAGEGCLKTEILRHLGRFHAAEEILLRRPPAGLDAIVQQLLGLCNNNDRDIRVLTPEAQAEAAGRLCFGLH